MLFALEQSLNSLELGVMLFLIAAGLTLVFGIMNLINLAHGSFYMIGAYVGATVMMATHVFVLALLAGMAATGIVGLLAETSLLRTLYARDPLDQVLVTFGMILFFNETTRLIWGSVPLPMDQPAGLTGHVQIVPGFAYPSYRLVIIGVGIAVAIALFFLIGRTRMGMQIRAGASDRMMAGALGLDIRRLYTHVFAVGAALAALAGVMAAPLLAVQVGMGDSVFVQSLVCIVIGGIGSVRGAFIGAIITGFVETFSQSLLPATLAEMSIYAVMVGILYLRPQGLFATRG
jgi:branched-chain amino acid transport system permease protein